MVMVTPRLNVGDIGFYLSDRNHMGIRHMLFYANINKLCEMLKTFDLYEIFKTHVLLMPEKVGLLSATGTS